MKRQLSLILLGLFGAAATLSCPAVFAQQSSNAQTTPPSLPFTHDHSLSKKTLKRFAQMTKRYKLAADQESQLQSILWEEQQDEQTANADTLMSSGSRRDELAGLHVASQQKFGSILNNRQKRKFDADEKTRAWMDGRLPDPNPGPALGLY